MIPDDVLEACLQGLYGENRQEMKAKLIIAAKILAMKNFSNLHTFVLPLVRRTYGALFDGNSGYVVIEEKYKPLAKKNYNVADVIELLENDFDNVTKTIRHFAIDIEIEAIAIIAQNYINSLIKEKFSKVDFENFYNNDE